MAAQEQAGMPPKASDSDLVGFIMSKVHDWRDARDPMRDRWNEYYRLWRGFWSSQDKQRDSERSRIIMPALANAVEMTVAEMQEATFGNGVFWFDVSDDVQDEEREDADQARALLHEDMNVYNVRDAISNTYVNSALYGTGIGKVVIEDNHDGTISCYLDAVNPNEFLIDPSARNVDEAYGCVHELFVPFSGVIKKQAQGIYNDEFITSYGAIALELKDGTSRKDFEASTYEDRENVLITEYHGLVPKRLLSTEEQDLAEGFRGETIVDPDSGDELVEAIVTIGNESVLLKAEENPLFLQDRAFVAYQHESVPGRFWGRGVAEKGYNPQKALDSEHRMRLDAMAYTAAPMFLYNLGALGGRRFQLNPRPGRQIPVSGQWDLNQVVAPVNMGQISPATFQQTQELERMVHLGTGAMDISGFSKDVAGAETAAGASISKSVFVKRAKLTMDNVERNFLQPVVKKMLMRYVQFDRRYPKKDTKFVINGSLGMVAREMEQQGLIQMISLVPQGSATQKELIRGYIESSSTPNKAQIIKALEADAQQTEEQQQAAQLQLQAQQLELQRMQLDNQALQTENQKTATEIKKIMAEIQKIMAGTQTEGQKVQIEQARVQQENRRLDQDDRRSDIEAARLVLDSRKSTKES